MNGKNPDFTSSRENCCFGEPARLGKFGAATKNYLLNVHLTSAETNWSLGISSEDILGWKLERQLASPLSHHEMIYNQLERRRWPLFSKEKQKISLLDQPELLTRLTCSLSRNLGFPVRDGELWKDVWQSQFSFLNSPLAVRTALASGKGAGPIGRVAR